MFLTLVERSTIDEIPSDDVPFIPKQAMNVVSKIQFLLYWIPFEEHIYEAKVESEAMHISFWALNYKRLWLNDLY